MDQHLSPQVESGDSDSSDLTPTATVMVVVPSKRTKRGMKTCAVSPKAVPTIKVDYVTAVFSSFEMRKGPMKRVPKNASFQLQTDKPWDTLKAQMLVKILDALDPPTIDFLQYNIMIAIPRVIAKPGIPLTSEAEYTMFLNRIAHSKSKNILTNVTVIQPDNDNDKENAPENDTSKSKKKLKDPALLPGNVKKVANVQALQEHWKCEKCHENARHPLSFRSCPFLLNNSLIKTIIPNTHSRPNDPSKR